MYAEWNLSSCSSPPGNISISPKRRSTQPRCSRWQAQHNPQHGHHRLTGSSVSHRHHRGAWVKRCAVTRRFVTSAPTPTRNDVRMPRNDRHRPAPEVMPPGQSGGGLGTVPRASAVPFFRGRLTCSFSLPSWTTRRTKTSGRTTARRTLWRRFRLAPRASSRIRRHFAVRRAASKSWRTCVTSMVIMRGDTRSWTKHSTSSSTQVNAETHLGAAMAPDLDDEDTADRLTLGSPCEVHLHVPGGPVGAQAAIRRCSWRGRRPRGPSPA